MQKKWLWVLILTAAVLVIAALVFITLQPKTTQSASGTLRTTNNENTASSLETAPMTTPNEAIPKIEEHEHVYEDELVLPTCTEKGFTQHTCSVCGESFSDTPTDALGHSWSPWQEIKAATTTEAGEKTRSCQTCELTESEAIPKITEVHTHIYIVKTVEPTCTEGGYTNHTCACGASYKDNEVAPKGHLYGSWEITTQATTEAAGERQCTCSRCGYINKEAIPKLDAATGEKYEYYIDPRIQITQMPFGTLYDFGSVGLTDKRTWGDPPTIRILDDGSFQVSFYQQDGSKTEFVVQDPGEGYARSATIRDSGEITWWINGDFSD